MTTDAGIEAGNVTSATGSGSVLDTAAGGGAVQEALHDAGRGIGVCPVCAKLLCILSLLIRCTIYAQTAETTTRVIGMTTAETDGTTDETIDGMTVDEMTVTGETTTVMGDAIHRPLGETQRGTVIGMTGIWTVGL